MDEYPGLVLAEEDNGLVARVRPAARAPLDAAMLRGLLQRFAAPEWVFFDAALDSLVERYRLPDAEFDLPIGQRRGAACTVEISGDGLQAWINLDRPAGAPALSEEEVLQALAEAGVKYGIDRAALSHALQVPEGGRFLVAAGVPAQDGENARFELLIDAARDRGPKVNEHGLIDFREQGEIPTVLADQPLMRRIPATRGVEGRSVRDEAINAHPGKNEGFAENLVGAYVSPEDANMLLAAFNGQPVSVLRGVSVEHVLRLRNVNMASGNIVFDGSVRIDGEVLPGMKVRATGDIFVGEVVDGGELEAGGDIHIGGGAIAKAKVRAGGAVGVRFVENAQIFAGSTLTIEDSALQSELQANNQILVGTKSGRGHLCGGTARAMLLIRTPVLGASTAGVTSLLLGVNPVLEASYQELLKQIEKARVEEENLGKLVKYLAKTGDKSGMLERANASWQKAVKAWGELLPQREALEAELASISEARVEIGIGVEGAVDLRLGQKTLHVRQNYAAGFFALSSGNVVFTAAGGG